MIIGHLHGETDLAPCRLRGSRLALLPPPYFRKTEGQWKIVYIESESKDLYRDIDGGIRYDHSQAAYRRCKHLNDAWHGTEKALCNLESE